MGNMMGVENWRALLDSSEDGRIANWPARILLFVTIALSVCSAGALTLPDLAPVWQASWRDAGILAGALFCGEYLWRMWRAPALNPADPHSRRHYLLSPLGLADLIALAPLLL